MAYTYKKEETELIPEGDYECRIDKAEFKETPTSHRKKIALTLRIRDDVEQNCKNRIVFDDIWSKKEDESQYDEHKINRILGTQEIKEGTEFPTINDVVKEMLGACLIAHIYIKHDVYNDRDVNQVKFYKRSEKGASKLADQMPSTNADAFGIDDDDVPF